MAEDSSIKSSHSQFKEVKREGKISSQKITLTEAMQSFTNLLVLETRTLSVIFHSYHRASACFKRTHLIADRQLFYKPHRFQINSSFSLAKWISYATTGTPAASRHWSPSTLLSCVRHNCLCHIWATTTDKPQAGNC